MVLQKGVVVCGSQQGYSGQVTVHLESVTLSLFVVSVTQAYFSSVSPPYHCHPSTATFLVTLFKSKKKTTLGFLKSCMWLRKPGVGMWPCNPLVGWRGNKPREGSKCHQHPFQLNFAFRVLALKSLLATHLRRLKNIIYSI